MFSPVLEVAINLLIPLYAVGGLLAFLAFWERPRAAKRQRRVCRKLALSTMQGGPCPHSQTAGQGKPTADDLGI